MQENKTQSSCFDSARLLLAPDTGNSYLELELIRTRSGLHLYLNILSLKAPLSCKETQTTRIKICFEDQEPREISVSLLKGQQRLLFPEDVQEKLIEALLRGETFTLMLGNACILVIPDEFPTLYNALIGFDTGS